MPTSKPFPEIRINLSILLYRGESRILDRYLNDGENKILSMDKYQKLTQQYREAWARYETVLLRGMIEALGVSFYRSVIDVWLAPYFGAKSAPLIINFRSDPDRFVDLLTHELLHVLQNDNNKYQSGGSKRRQLDLMAEWKRIFGEHDHLTLVHIPVHVLHKYLYLDVLGELARLERDIRINKESKRGLSYVRAWEYVNNHDYRSMISQLRAIYEKS